MTPDLLSKISLLLHRYIKISHANDRVFRHMRLTWCSCATTYIACNFYFPCCTTTTVWATSHTLKCTLPFAKGSRVSISLNQLFDIPKHVIKSQSGSIPSSNSFINKSSIKRLETRNKNHFLMIHKATSCTKSLDPLQIHKHS